jgi:hypothetical protein
VTLRLSACRNGQVRRIRRAEAYAAI